MRRAGQLEPAPVESHPVEDDGDGMHGLFENDDDDDVCRTVMGLEKALGSQEPPLDSSVSGRAANGDPQEFPAELLIK